MASERQSKTSNDQEELRLRREDVGKLLDSLVGRYAEYFNDPGVRIDFIKDQGAGGLLKIARHINARLRGEIPRVVRNDPNETGVYLQGIHTPDASVKPAAFMRGFDAIQEYLAETDDSAQEQARKVSLAVEALVIWVHPFNDGNGRTSRFLAEFIEKGATDKDRLVSATSDRKSRSFKHLRGILETRESLLAGLNHEDVFIDDDVREAMRLRADSSPDDVEGMYLSIKRLIDNQSLHTQTGGAEDKGSTLTAVA